MKHYNKSFEKLLGFVGLFCNRQNWFFCCVIPAIANQKYCVAIMIGTHGRYGLLLGNRWVINGAKGVQS